MQAKRFVGIFERFERFVVEAIIVRSCDIVLINKGTVYESSFLNTNFTNATNMHTPIRSLAQRRKGTQRNIMLRGWRTACYANRCEGREDLRMKTADGCTITITKTKN